MRKYASSIEKGNNNTLFLHIYPGANSRFELLEDDGTSNDYLKGIYASTTIELKNSADKFALKINPVQGNYEGMSSERNWVLNIHCSKTPKQIRLNRKSIKFSYDNVNKIAVVETAQLPLKQLRHFEVSY